MASETRRGLVRILSNYGRLFASLVIGLIVVRVLLGTLGNDAWALIALLGIAAGFAQVLREVVASSMIRELGEAHHSGDDDRFRTVYNSALSLMLVVGSLAFAVMLGFRLVVPLLDVPDELIGAGKFMILCRGAEMAAVITLAPAFNMYKVTERMTAFNVCRVVTRLCQLAAALWLLFMGFGDDPAHGLMLYAGISSGLVVLALVIEVGILAAIDRRLVPSLGRTRRSALRQILHVGGWNAAALTAVTMQLRIDGVLMNLYFGLAGNLCFGLAQQLSAYIRMITTGMTDGLDAVAARISTVGVSDELRRLVHHASRLNGLVAIPACLGMVLLAEPILVTWVGDRIEDPATTVGPTVMIVRVLSLGMFCRSVGDGWAKILYGAGHIRRYAPVVLLGGVLNPLIAIALIPLVGLSGPAWAYSIVLLAVHFLYLPWQAARVLDATTRDMLKPFLSPLLATAACAPILVAAMLGIADWSLLKLAGVIIGFGMAYGLVVAFVVLDGTERRRVWSAVRRRMGRGVAA